MLLTQKNKLYDEITFFRSKRRNYQLFFLSKISRVVSHKIESIHDRDAKASLKNRSCRRRRRPVCHRYHVCERRICLCCLVFVSFMLTIFITSNRISYKSAQVLTTGFWPLQAVPLCNLPPGKDMMMMLIIIMMMTVFL